MPNKKDFTDIINIEKIFINPVGWVNPICIEYGVGFHFATPSYFWRVKETTHTFIIPIVRFEFLSEGNYNKHFEEVLEKFREDYLEWKKGGFETEWMREYREEYSRFILV